MAQKEMLQERALSIRTSVVRMIHGAGSGHVGGSLGMADIFTALYFHVFDKSIHTTKEDRDRFILSNGHICPVWYVALAEAGFLHKDELMTLRQINSKLQGHPANHDLPLVGNRSPSNNLTVVVFPEPLGPSNPNISPC